MTEPTQDLLLDIESTQVVYSTFWQRFWASIIDGLVLSPILLVDNFDKSTWKSLPILVLTTLVGLAYRPFMEFKYCATLGKMALNLTIINTDFEKPSLRNIILRDIFDISSRLIVAVTTFITFFNPGFENIDSAVGFSTLSNALTGATWIVGIMSLISLTDAIFLIADPRRRALHDRIGQTLVIRK